MEPTRPEITRQGTSSLRFSPRLVKLVPWIIMLLTALTCFPATGQVPASVDAATQSRMVKIFGSGGYANLHAYQTGCFVSATGKIVTVWSHVLDGRIVVIDSTGRRSIARFVGMDPETELAVLEIDRQVINFFDLQTSPSVAVGTKIAAFSNLFGIASGSEKLSVMSGIVSATTELDGKLAQFNSPYRGQVLVLDLITNNPGAAGGAVVDLSGNWVGIIGKELQDRSTGIWLNFCLPVDVVAKSVRQIESGATAAREPAGPASSPLKLDDLGVELIPRVVETTSPYVDRVLPDSAAAKIGILPDDRIVFVNAKPVRTIDEVREQFATIDRDQSVNLILRRQSELITVQLSRFSGSASPSGEGDR